MGMWSNGNIGPNCQTSGSPGSRTVNYSVGAYDINDQIADFSSRGTGQDGEIKPNISAPGVNVRSSVPGNGYEAFNGTSMAAPHTAGAVALLWSTQPELIGDIGATRGLLDDTARDTADDQCGGNADDNNVYGEGRLDALALAEAAPAGAEYSLIGKVRARGTGDPLIGASVTVEKQGMAFEATTNDKGRYRIAAVPAGVYQVTAASPPCDPRSKTVVVNGIWPPGKVAIKADERKNPRLANCG
jgi:subtilisin family serine protease